MSKQTKRDILARIDEVLSESKRINEERLRAHVLDLVYNPTQLTWFSAPAGCDDIACDSCADCLHAKNAIAEWCTDQFAVWHVQCDGCGHVEQCRCGENDDFDDAATAFNRGPIHLAEDLTDAQLLAQCQRLCGPYSKGLFSVRVY